MKTLKLVIFAIVATSAPVAAQETLTLSLAPGSKLVMSGTSSLHPFSCSTSDIKATIKVPAAALASGLGGMAAPISEVDVTIPVRSLKCEKKALAENMYKAMKADKFPQITYRMTSIEAKPASSGPVSAVMTGVLTIAGKSNTTSMNVVLSRSGANSTAKGSQELLMSQYGIKPPSMMMGAIKTGDKVAISLDLVAATPDK